MNLVAELLALLESGVPLDEARKKIRGNLCVLTGAGAGGGFVRCDTGAAFRKDADTLKAKRSDTAAAILKARELAKADGKPKTKAEIQGIIAKLSAKQRQSIGAERAGIVAARVEAAAKKAQATIDKAKRESDTQAPTGMTPALQKALKKLQARFPNIEKENGKDWGKESVYFEKKVDPTLIDAVKKWASKLEWDEKDALNRYTGSSYDMINGCMAEKNCNEYNANTVKTLMALLEEGPKIPKDAVAWRGTLMRPEIAGAIEAFKSGKKKATIFSPVFMSASLDPQIAHTFATNYKNNVMLRIRNHGTYVDPVSQNPGEQEAIYPPGKYRVVNVQKVEPRMYGDPIAYTVVDLEPVVPKKRRRLSEGEENPAHHYAAMKFHKAEYDRLMKDPGPGPVKPEDRIVKGSAKKRMAYEVPWSSEIEDLTDGAFDDVMGDEIEEALTEGQKKIAGNLCVNVGQGSGGGFTACGKGSGGNTSDDEVGARSFAGFERIGPQTGSNPGGLFKDPQGTKFYVKWPKTEDHARNEVLAGKLYELAGIRAPELSFVQDGDKIGVASKIVDGLKPARQELIAGTLPGVKRGFGMDAWLANWDVVGLGFDNLLKAPDGAAMRVDTGGALRYRAQGGPKGSQFGTVVGELATMRDKSRESGKVFGNMSADEVKRSVSVVTSLSPSKIESVVRKYGPKDEATREALLKTLLARRKNMAQQVGIEIAEAQGWGFLRKSKPQNPKAKGKSWDWKKSLKPKPLSLEAEDPRDGLREFFAAIRAGESLEEARKKLRGNLCVLTGVGSGGGFVPCNSGSFGRSDKPTLQAHRSATAASMRDTYKKLKAAIAAGDKDAIDKIRKEAIPGRFAAILSKATGQKGAKDALSATKAAAEAAKKAAEDAAAAAAKKAADDAAAAAKKAADDAATAAKKAGDDALAAATKKVFDKPTTQNLAAAIKLTYARLDAAAAKKDQAEIDKIKADPVTGIFAKSWEKVRKYQADEKAKKEAEAAALAKKLDAKPKVAKPKAAKKPLPKVPEFEHAIYGKTNESGATFEGESKFGDAKSLVGSKKGDPELNAKFEKLQTTLKEKIASQRAFYEKYNTPAKEIERRMKKLTATIPEAQVPIGEWERGAILNKFESAALYDQAGNMIFAKKGGAHQVKFGYGELSLMKDGVLTHNHPSALALSHGDIKLAVRYDLAEIRAVGAFTDGNGKVIARTEFSLKRPVGGWKVTTLHGSQNISWAAESDPHRLSKNFVETTKSNRKLLKDMGIPESAYSFRVVDHTEKPVLLRKNIIPSGIVKGKVGY